MGVIKATFLAPANGPANRSEFMEAKKIEVKQYPIRLGQFLKLAGLVSDGNQAKMYISSGSVFVNGASDLRRGRKLAKGDLVKVENDSFLCC